MTQPIVGSQPVLSVRHLLPTRRILADCGRVQSTAGQCAWISLSIALFSSRSTNAIWSRPTLASKLEAVLDNRKFVPEKVGSVLRSLEIPNYVYHAECAKLPTYHDMTAMASNLARSGFTEFVAGFRVHDGNSWVYEHAFNIRRCPKASGKPCAVNCGDNPFHYYDYQHFATGLIHDQHLHDAYIHQEVTAAGRHVETHYFLLALTPWSQQAAQALHLQVG